MIVKNRPDIKRRLKILFPAFSLVSLVWFLIRVAPKPSRAMYPCQRIAFPLASGFVAWLVVTVGSVAAFGKARRFFRQSRPGPAIICLIAAFTAGLFSLTHMQRESAMADPPVPNAPIGTAKGLNPGRVVWVHAPDSTDWEGVGDGHWWESEHTDKTVVDQMMYRAIRRLSGQASDADAWDAIFRHFNRTHGKGDIGYEAGEKIAIKINFVGCIDSPIWGGVDPDTYDLVDDRDYMNTSPQMMLALLHQLIYEAGVAPADISIGDPLALFPNQYYEPLHNEFPAVRFLDSRGYFGRTAVQPSSVNVYWSCHPEGVTQDKVLLSFAEADYFINLAHLKSHAAAGVTLCGKNYYGWLRFPFEQGYYNLHDTLPFYFGGTGNYRCIVDLMGHAESGGKALLYLVDGLYPGVHPDDTAPIRWSFPPFDGDWTSSLFVSQDPVAVDSLGFDFLQEEGDPRQYPHMPGADDYLIEAALANDPPSGTFYDPNHAGDVSRLESLGVHEHWNNPVSKQYSRNLGTGDGIELVQCLGPQSTSETLNVEPVRLPITIDGDPGDWDLSDFTTYSPGGEEQIGDTALVGWHMGALYYGDICTEPGFQPPADASDHTALVYSRHDATHQYFLVRIDDDVVMSPFDESQNWRNDCVELFVDPGHHGDAAPAPPTTSEFQLVIDSENRQNVYITTSDYRSAILEGVSSAVSEDGTGWWLELRIAKGATNPRLPAGGTFGINFNFRDLDDAQETNRTLYLWSDDYSGSGAFPDKTPANWGDCYNPFSTGAPDADYDGVPDSEDNCIDIPNPDQTDSDQDSWGEACDCDDTAPHVNPGMQGRDCSSNPDGIDDDCDGQIDEDPCGCFISCHFDSPICHFDRREKSFLFRMLHPECR